MKKTIFFLAIIFLLTSCADNQPNISGIEGHVYGFWGGLWHGIIVPFDFIGSLIWDDVSVYAINNNGAWYDFGFILGIGALYSGSSQSSK